MKKIAIVTITNSGCNFGNRLQNYALQKKLKMLGWNVETIRSANTVGNSKMLSKFRYCLKSVVKMGDARHRAFRKFNHERIRFAKQIRFGELNSREFSDQYDIFLAGSDQIWNPNLHFNSDFEFLTFTVPEKRYSYAASIGVSSIEPEIKQHFVENLEGMHTISVREQSSVELVRELTGRTDICCHIDPTMLLREKDYVRIEEKPKFQIPDTYLLVYLLGQKTEEMKTFISNLSARLNLEVLELSEDKSSQYYGIGPEHFIYCVRHAKYVCTDSFHGGVFSILFHRQFTMFVRNDADVPMNSRIETLLQITGLNDRLLNAQTIEEAILPIDYTKTDQALKTKRQEAERYLENIEKEDN